MTILEKFTAYAKDFEQTFIDDDWTRLNGYFADDAVYEVRGVGFGCDLLGRSNIFRGIKRSLDNFDRRFDSRKIEVTSVPEVSEDTFSASWTVTYTKAGAPPFLLRGHTVVTYAGGRIIEMIDSYTEEMGREAAAWISQHAPDFNPAYT
jgi:hypothetical protein